MLKVGKQATKQEGRGITLLGDNFSKWEVAFTIPACTFWCNLASTGLLCSTNEAVSMQRQFCSAAAVCCEHFAAHELCPRSLCQTPALITGVFDPASQILQRKSSGRKNN